MYDAQLWRHPSAIMKSVDFTISPADKPEFLKQANQTELYLTTISSNVQQLFNQQTVKNYTRRQMSSFDWNNFYRVDDIYSWLRDLNCTYTDAMNLFSIGTTVENRPIYAVNVSHAGSRRHNYRSVVLVEGGIHAREWISVAYVTYLLNKVLNAPSDTDKEFQDIAYQYDWVFVPLLNPDGYEYSHTHDRLWRKNRNNKGVDINRNFDVAFGTVGVCKKASAPNYCGRSPFSEQESLAMATLVEEYKDRLSHYLAFHSYGQYIILPYMHLKEHLDNYDEVAKVARDMAAQIKRNYGTEYTVGTAYDTLGYTTSGASTSWVKKTYHVPYVMTIDLRDEGQEGFALSPENILPTCKETIDGLVTFLKETEAVNIRTSGCESLRLKLYVSLLHCIVFYVIF
ncbi:zinc carboxypeptidase [Amyelois transitella]|uniref:zinc carboxypeptidase n=1 Tax=Amyelois transitella TaxID=680683 RepID=UPI00298FF3CB|nr:zinc carboxypeptidase [Amyelois transitella]